MNHDNVRLMQKVQLEIMEAFHNICKKNGICYYMVGGTLLGAVRHKGFIPWDADVDIAMPRKDYDLFINKYSEQLLPKYRLLTHENYKYFTKPHALIIQEGSVLKTEYDLLNRNYASPGIYIELFPLDNVPKDRNKQLKQDKKIIRIEQAIYRKASLLFKNDTWFKRISKYIVRFLLYPISFRRLGAMLQSTMKQYNTTEDYTGLLCSMAGKHGYKKESLPKEMYGDPVLLEFEGSFFYAPIEYKKFLEHYYGDYMTLPSKEEQEHMYNYFSVIEVG